MPSSCCIESEARQRTCAFEKIKGEADSWEDDRGKDSKTHQALSADVQEFLRSRVGPSNVYTVGRSHIDNLGSTD